MKNTKQSKKMAVHSLVWAGLMLLEALLFRGHEDNSTLMILMVGAWYLSHHLTLSKSNQACCVSTNDVLNHKEDS